MLGIDQIIENINESLTSFLWTDKNFTKYGRVFRNVRDDQNDVPEYYVGNGEYIDTLLDDTKDAVCFYDVQSTEDEFQYANVWICFAANLRKLYPSVTERATEHAHRDAFLALTKSSIDPETLVRGFEAFSTYGFTDQNRMDMEPYYLFRFEFTAEYNLC